MCGIVGYIGNKQCFGPIIDGLETLEYRGYDSAGIAYLENSQVKTIKQVGSVQALKEKAAKTKHIDSQIGIGHTRWATHGSPTLANAHPHSDMTNSVYVVHNGIIENHEQIRKKLVDHGYTFLSETDTEVIPNLIHLYSKKLDHYQAFKKAITELQGAFAIAAFFVNDTKHIYAAKLSAPLIIGRGKAENFIASDPIAILEHTNKIIYLDDYEIAEISGKNVKIENIKNQVTTTREAELYDENIQKATLGDFPHFMLKEIFEAPQTVQSAIRGRVLVEKSLIKLGGLESVDAQLKYIDRIVIVACGTSYYAGLIGEYLIEEIAGIPVEVQLASEFKYRNEPFSRSTAILAISQSGETADTIAALKKVEDYGVLRLGVVNAVGSTIARMTDAGVYCHAGPEQSVASTKAFMAQVSVMAQIALHLASNTTKLRRPMIEELVGLPDKIKKVLTLSNDIKKLAEKYSHHRDFLYIGRNYLYPAALEGALKLKELTYIHAEGFAAGEMKHGPLAMIDKNFPTLALLSSGELFEKTLSNIQEIKARGGPVIAIVPAGKGKKLVDLVDDVIEVPKTIEQLEPLIMVPALQLFAYHMTVMKGLDVDKPRNLAKSVTVE